MPAVVEYEQDNATYQVRKQLSFTYLKIKGKTLFVAFPGKIVLYTLKVVTFVVSYRFVYLA